LRKTPKQLHDSTKKSVFEQRMFANGNKIS